LRDKQATEGNIERTKNHNAQKVGNLGNSLIES
jgi:hypothetical protein